MTITKWLAVGACAVTMAVVAEASAQTQTQGFSLNRFDPSERGSDWFSNESLDFRGSNRPAAGVVGDWGYKPLVLYDANGDEVRSVVKHQLFAHVGFSHMMWSRLRLGVSLPIAPIVKGKQDVNGLSVEEGATIGDLRLGADLRLFGEYGGGITMALGAQVHLPTGKREAFTGDSKVRVVPRLLLAGDLGAFTYSARVGANFRMLNENFNGQPFGTELLFGAAAGVRLADKKLLLGPEIYGSTVVSDSGDGFLKRKTTPFEVLIGGHYRVADDWRFGAGVGPGLTRGVGAPKLRVLASIEWFPWYEEPKAEEPPKDTDGDGILDIEDACPMVQGQPNADPAKHGCPPPSDRDGDGIIDEQDACPDEAGVASEDPTKHGCPLPPDRDGDGIIDPQDACPDEAGVASEDPAKNGCPPPKDRDGDGIFDEQDACPDEPGVPDLNNPSKHGCPKAVVVGKEIKILERVEFDTNKATIRPESDAVLNAVLEILRKFPDIKKVSVEGHTDNTGGMAHNKKLSERRAAAVVDWLKSHGIEGERLVSKGFGQTKPIQDNKTPEGRQNNRRVEFHILERADSGNTTEVKPPAPPARK